MLKAYVKDLEQEFPVLVPPEETAEELRGDRVEEKREGRGGEERSRCTSGRKA